MTDLDETENEEIETLTPEETLQIAQHYLLSSPPGQFHEVLTDVRKIIPDGLLTDALASGMARLAHLKNNKVVSLPSGQKTILSSSGEIDPTHYFDPINANVFILDHFTNVAAEDNDSIQYNLQDKKKETERAALQVEINKYVSSTYPSENSAGGVFARDGKLVIAISGEKTSLKNFWSGKWSSAWQVSFDDESIASISGDIKVHIHIFEDGNLQLQNSKTINATTLNYESNEELFKKIIDHIKSEESILQNGFEEMYSEMQSETLRAMRRVMPITRTKMEWNINAVRMVRQVRK